MISDEFNQSKVGFSAGRVKSNQGFEQFKGGLGVRGVAHKNKSSLVRVAKVGNVREVVGMRNSSI
jgi:hypothetical protein